MKTPKKTTAGADDSARIAKVIARAGVCSRREAETLIAEGRVALNGTVLETPAVVVKPGDVVTVDGQPLPERERTRLWMFHKPRGVVTTTHDPEGRPTVFDVLPPDLPRVMTVGRLDINTEGCCCSPTTAASRASWNCRRRGGCGAIACAPTAT